MKKITKIICLFLIAVVLASGFIGCGSSPEKPKEYSIKLLKEYSGKNVATVDMNIARYIRNVDNTNQLAFTLNERYKSWKKGEFDRLDYQKLDISWEDTKKGETYTVHVSDDKNFKNEFTYTTTKTSVSKEIGIFIPNKTYYYKVVGSISGESKTDSVVPNAGVRYISAGKTINMRDIGGWTTKDGKQINYGKIYRGAALNEGPKASYLDDNAKSVFDYLGIKGEIDLRGTDLGGAENKNDENLFLNKINSEYPILRSELVYFAYDNMTGDLSRAKNNLPKIFEFLSKEENYPVYFHCSVGADRTGTLAYIIEALLGVEFNNLMLDFELTSFTDMNISGGIRARSTIEDKGMDGLDFAEPSALDLVENNRLWYAHTLLMDKYSSYSSDLQKVMEKYLLDVGVSKNHIEKFKQIMLG